MILWYRTIGVASSRNCAPCPSRKSRKRACLSWPCVSASVRWSPLTLKLLRARPRSQRKRSTPSDYETVKRSRRSEGSRLSPVRAIPANGRDDVKITNVPAVVGTHAPFLKRGHVLSFAALFLFTVLLYVRPAELYPSPW